MGRGSRVDGRGKRRATIGHRLSVLQRTETLPRRGRDSSKRKPDTTNDNEPKPHKSDSGRSKLPRSSTPFFPAPQPRREFRKPQTRNRQQTTAKLQARTRSPGGEQKISPTIGHYARGFQGCQAVLQVYEYFSPFFYR